MPTPPPRRRFTLIDALILVVPAAAVAFTVRLHQRDAGLPFYDPAYSATFSSRFLHYANLSLKLIEPGIAALTFALLVMRLLPPRPRRARLMRQPGMAALLAASVVLGVDALMLAFALIGVGYVPVEEVYIQFGEPLYEPTGAAVAAAWVALLVSGRWRSEPSWVDRAGRLVGAVWVVVLLTTRLVGFWLTAEFLKANPPPTPAQIAQRKARDEAEEAFLKKWDALEAEVGRMLQRQRQMLSDGTPNEEYVKLSEQVTKKLNEQTEMLNAHYPNTGPGFRPLAPILTPPPPLFLAEPPELEPPSKDKP